MSRLKVIIACLIFIFLAITTTFLLADRSSRKQKADVMTYVVNEVARLGGPRAGSNLPSKLITEWRINQSDQNGFEIFLPVASFEQVESVFRTSFGDSLSVRSNAVGGKSAMYAASKIGVAIHFFSSGGQGVQINCVRALTYPEVMERLGDPQ